jgi:mRNA interferase RelE/StbE
VTYAVIWEPTAIDLASRFLTDDPAGLRDVFAAVDRLTAESRPANAFQLGSSGLLRLRIGRDRVVYDLDEQEHLIKVRHLGRRT